MDFHYLSAVLQGLLMDGPLGSMAVHDFYEPHRLAILIEQADVGAHRSHELLSTDAGSSRYEVYRKLFAALVACCRGIQVSSQILCHELLDDCYCFAMWGAI